ncbi:Uncharacterised protein [uncultured archaeon]|nr:Uncharacterised protein [uncultured archaeon]
MIFELLELAIFALHVIGALCFLLVVFFAIKLYGETDKGWYWLALVLSAVIFAFPQWLSLTFPPGPGAYFSLSMIREATDITGSVLFAVACYGMYRTMKRIRKRVE